jgi:magnesium and cobalt exporter, CNNM family
VIDPWILGAALGGLAAALFAVADGALLGLAEQRVAGVPTTTLLEDPEQTHRALIFGRRTALLVTGVALASALDLADRTELTTNIIIVALAALLVLTLDSVARSVGHAAGARALAAVSPFVRPLLWIVTPVTTFGRRIDRSFRALGHPSTHEEAHDAVTEQFREIVSAEADVSRYERALLNRVFSLGDTEVREIMVPRVDVLGIDRSMTWSEMLDRVRSSEHARLPVYHDTLDYIDGVLYAKDLLPAVIADEPPEGGWLKLVRSATFIPTTKPLDEQLRDFKLSRTHIAVVIDEYGGTAGIVTIEDVLEEIVGEIRDEYDVEEPEIEQEGDSRFWVSGRVTLDDLSALLDGDFRREDITTVGGLIYDVLGRVPKAGETLNLNGYRVVVERVRRRRVERVYFERVGAFSARADE